MNHAFKTAALGLTLTLAACSALETDKVDYKSTVKAPSLAVPPDLTQLPRDTRYATPGTAVSATGYQSATQAAGANMIAVASVGDVRIQRAGNQRWLVVDRPADKLWIDVKDFWQENGFQLAKEDANLGIMETNWAENRGKLPQDFMRRTFGKVLDVFSSTGELDMFHTRLERNAAGGTEIYISHRGLIEVFADEQKIKTVWKVRPSEPELETELLRRLMVKLGVGQEQSKMQVASAQPSKLTSRLATAGGQPIVQIDEGFDRAWRRVGLSLDRTGFTVEDRDRSQGTYFVRYVEPKATKEEPGFFSRMFSETPKPIGPQKYRIMVRSQGDQTTVSVLNAEGAPEVSENAQRILKVLADDLQ